MGALALDTLKYARRLEAGGFSREQAIAAAEAMADALGEIVVTREHFDPRMAQVDIKLAEIEAEIERRKAETLKWMGGSLIAQTGLIVALIKLIPS